MEPRRSLTPSRRSSYRCLLSLVLLAVYILRGISTDDVFTHDFLLPGNRDTSFQCNASLVLFGIPKSFPIIWKQYQTNLIHHNPHVNFRIISLHLYSDIQFLDNAKNKELQVPIETPMQIAQTFHLLSQHNPLNLTDILIQTSQNEFDKLRLDTWLSDKHADTFDPCCWTKETLKNMFRQGNSIYESFQHAKRREQYPVDFYVFARSDTYLARPVTLTCGIETHQLKLPSWQIHLNDEQNDRFAVAGPLAAEIYVNAKADAFYRYVQDPVAAKSPRSTHKWNSEHMLWLWTRENRFRLEVQRQDKSWAPLLRIRGGQRVNSRDSRTFPRGYLEHQR